MRIGSHDITPITLIHIAVVAVLALALLIFSFRTYSSVRASLNRATVMNAMTDNSEVAALEQSAEACNALIAADPAQTAPRFYLGCVFCKQGKYKEAKAAFEQVAAAKNATAEERSLAFTAAANALALDGAKEGRPENIEGALQLVQKALDAQATPDALAAQAIFKSWQETVNDTELESLTQKALAATPAPGAIALEQLYRIQGAVMLRAKKAAEASDAFARVKAINPFNNAIGEAGRNAQLHAMLDTNLDPVERRKLIESVVLKSQDFGKQRNEALIAAAQAWLTFSSAPDFYVPDGPSYKARALLNQLIQSDPKDLRAYRIQVAVLIDRIEQDIKGLTVTVAGLNGEDPVGSRWAEVKAPAEISKENADLLVRIKQQSGELEALLSRYSMQLTDKKELLDTKLRQLLAIRKQAWCCRPSEASYREALLTKAVVLAEDIAAKDESGRGFWQVALVQIERGKLPEVAVALNQAHKRGFTSPDFEKLRSDFSPGREVLEYGPLPNERQFGASQLVRATLKAGDAGMLSNVSMAINGREVKKMVVNSQVFSLIEGDNLTGSAQTIKIKAESAPGVVIDFPEFSLSVDKEAPTWTVAPINDGSKTQGWQIELKDVSGIEWSKLGAGIRPAKPTPTQPEMILIKDGKYARALPAIKVMSGDAVKASPFKLASSAELPAGEYKIWIEAQDLLGNKAKDEKTITIK